jgi:hypothetical protein
VLAEIYLIASAQPKTISGEGASRERTAGPGRVPAGGSPVASVMARDAFRNDYSLDAAVKIIDDQCKILIIKYINHLDLLISIPSVPLFVASPAISPVATDHL